MEMNGRLRLDKLQELIEQYLRETRPTNQMNEYDSEPESNDRNYFMSADKENVVDTTSSLRNSLVEKSNQLGALMPIYIKVSSLSVSSKKASVEAELEKAVPFSNLLSHGRCDFVGGSPASEEYSGTPSDLDNHKILDSNDSIALRNERELKLMMHRSLSLPITLLSRVRGSTSLLPDNAEADDGRINHLSTDTSGSRSSGEYQREWSVSNEKLQTTGDFAIQSDVRGLRRRSLVNREAKEFSMESHQRTRTNSPNVNRGVHGLLATALEQSRCTIPLIPADDLMIIDRLSTGRISSIYRGVWMSRSQHNEPYQVALKVATLADGSSPSDLEELRREADIASQLHHFNLCELKGLCHTPE